MHSHSRSSQFLATGLSALAGFIDSVGFISLGGLFVSFMSGNSTRFGVGVVEDISLPSALVPVCIIFLFVVGVALGKIIRHHAPKWPSFAVMVFMCANLFAAALAQQTGFTIVAFPCMIMAMGAANNVFIREGEVSIGVTYMTGTLVKMGQKIAGRFLNEPKSEWLPYFLLWLGLIVGAVAGAAAYKYMGLSSLWLACGLCAMLSALAIKLDKDLRR